MNHLGLQYQPLSEALKVPGFYLKRFLISNSNPHLSISGALGRCLMSGFMRLDIDWTKNDFV